jgi:hypothetical protein
MGRGCAQVLKNLGNSLKSRIADKLKNRYETVIEFAGGRPALRENIRWRISGSRA